MRFLRFLILFLGVFFLNFGISFGVAECCYDSSSLIVAKSLGCDVVNGDTFVGLPNQAFANSFGSSDVCLEFNQKRQGCFDANNACFATANGKSIFNLPTLSNINNVLLGYCPNGFKPFDSATCNGNSVSIGGGNNNGNVGNNGGGGGGAFQPNPITPNSGSGGTVVTLNDCSINSGGPFGFFISNSSCESVVDATGNNCLYNPAKGGFLSSFSGFRNSNFLFPGGIKENSCVRKTEISSCYDYNTKLNCDGNRANISDSCLWKSSGSFLPLSLSSKNGICISNKISQTSFFNSNFYGDRGNLVINPSFENGLTSWGGNVATGNLVGSQPENSYNGYFHYNLQPGTYLTSDISNPTIGGSYMISLYAKFVNSSTISTDGIGLNIKTFSKTGVQVSTNDLSPIFLSSIDRKNNTFSVMNFGSFTIPNDVNIAKVVINFSIVGVSPIAIDAISFQASNSNNLNTLNQIFSPNEIIPPQASNCNLCFEDLGFNSCTLAKSNLLGDCSYMVPNVASAYEPLASLTNYFGLGKNPYIYNSTNSPDNNLKWKSQSLANSRLFCGLYLTKATCENSTNYVNSKFLQSNLYSSLNSLCKWDAQHGCFKDSNNDGLQDFVRGTPEKFFRGYKILNPNFPQTSELFNTSDFLQECDNAAPNNYLFFTAKDNSGKEVVITNQSNIQVGNLVLNLDINDEVLNSCNGFNVTPKIYIDLKVNNYSAFYIKNSNQFRDAIPLKTFLSSIPQFVDLHGNQFSYSQDLIFNPLGENNFSFHVYDQSGNLGKKFNFSFSGLDLVGPKINLTNFNYSSFTYPWINSGNLGKGVLLNFSIIDFSNFTCISNITSISGAPTSFLSKTSQSFSKSNLTAGIFSFNISEFITNSSNSGDDYLMTLSCVDSFGQSSLQRTKFSVDFRTSVVVVSPQNSYSGNSSSLGGYLNSNTLFNVASTERLLNNCNLSGFPNLISTRNLNLNNIISGFSLLNYPTNTFYINVTGNLNFSTNGVQNGKVVCSDSNSNIFTKNLSYISDRVSPKILNFSLNNIIFADNSNSTYFNGTSYFIRRDGAISVNLSFNGTFSWVDSISNISAWNLTGPISSLSNLTYTKTNFVADDFGGISSFTIENFDKNAPTSSSLNPLYLGNSINGEGSLFEKNYSFDFFDRAGNKNSSSISFFYDNSIPSFAFGGDIVTFDSVNNLIYTTAENPKIDITFNAPRYRTYSCNIVAKSGASTYQKSFASTSNLSITLRNISVNLNFNQNINLSFSCDGLYGDRISSSFLLIKDNLRPILKGISLDASNHKIYRAGTGAVYPDIRDKLVFDLVDTNELIYSCSYSFRAQNTNAYVCKGSFITSNFTNPIFPKTSNLLIFGTNSNVGGAVNPICIRSTNFNTNMATAIANNQNFDTRVNVVASCKDNVGLSSVQKTLPVIVTYVPPNKDLISLDFVFRNGKVFSQIKSFQPFTNIKIATNSLADGLILDSLSNPVNITGTGLEQIYFYESATGFDLAQLSNGPKTLYGVAFNEVTNTAIGNIFISKVLNVDKKIPKTSLKIPDESFNIVYSPNFWIDLLANDFSGSLAKVELLLDGNIIMSFNGTLPVVYDNTSLRLSNGGSFTFSGATNSQFAQSVEFLNGTIGQTYTFTVKAYDSSNNMNSSSKTILINDGVGIILNDSIDALVDSSKRNWVTKANTPILNFSTSRSVDSCQVFPYADDRWTQITGNQNLGVIFKSFGAGNSFSINMTNYSNFNLSLVPDKSSSIKIVCAYNGTLYNYSRNVNLVNFLPDYVLTPIKGFVINDAPLLNSYEVVVRSVGPFKNINCKYSLGINSRNYIIFTQKDLSSFSQLIDFSQFSNQIVPLNLVCTDLLGNVGPLKTYNFSVNSAIVLDIVNVSIYNPSLGYTSKNISNVINVGSLSNLDLSFNINKQNNIDCSYVLNSGGNVFSSVINFFENLFSIGTVNIANGEVPYVYKAKGITFNSESGNSIRISCQGPSGSPISKTFNVNLVTGNSNSLNSVIFS